MGDRPEGFREEKVIDGPKAKTNLPIPALLTTATHNFAPSVRKTPFPNARLNDDEIAVATCMLKMKEYLDTGTDFYSLQDALQDMYFVPGTFEYFPVKCHPLPAVRFRHVKPEALEQSGMVSFWDYAGGGIFI